MMVLATLSFFAELTPVSFTWFFAWRFLSGLTGRNHHGAGGLRHSAARSAAGRGIVGGVIFAGVGLGVAASGTLVPLFFNRACSRAGMVSACSRPC